MYGQAVSQQLAPKSDRTVCDEIGQEMVANLERNAELLKMLDAKLNLLFAQPAEPAIAMKESDFGHGDTFCGSMRGCLERFQRQNNLLEKMINHFEKII